MKSKSTLKASLFLCLSFTLLFGTSLNAQTLTIVSPASVAGEYPVKPAVFGPLITGPINGQIILADDGISDPYTTDACEALLNNMTGKIALIDRGGCFFVNKAMHAQDVGAVLVIICNFGEGDPAITMAGDDMGLLNIPSVNMSYDDCEFIRTEIDNNLTAMATPFAPGESCPTAFNISEGTHTVNELKAGGAVFDDAASASWYSYTPDVDGEINISACGGGVDTRLFVSSDECSRSGTPILIENDNNCDLGDGTLNASEVNFSVVAGTEYKIFWDDRWDSNGFEFSLSNSSVSAEDIEFNNDISIYPNPANLHTNIEYLFDQSNDLKIQLMNNLGQQIKMDLLNNVQNGIHQLKLNDLAPGIYFIHITNGEQSMVEKLFVE